MAIAWRSPAAGDPRSTMDRARSRRSRRCR